VQVAGNLYLSVMPYRFILLIAVTCLLACCRKKESTPEPDPEPAGPVVPADTGFKCGNLPPSPYPFAWIDSTFDENRNVNAFFRNPLNGDEVIVIVNGDAFGYNKMINYNLKLKQSKLLATVDSYLPDVNSKGWIVYSTAENNVFRIKANGDSLKQLTNMNLAHDPKWDHTGTRICFFQDAYSNVPSQLIKINTAGAGLLVIELPLPNSAQFNKSNHMIYQQVNNFSVTLVKKNLDTFEETSLISGPYSPQSKSLHFDNLVLDNEDQNMYWSNAGGIFRCSLSTLKTDTLFRNCENMIHLRPVINHGAPELNFARHIIRPISTYVLYHQYKTYEMNLQTSFVSEQRIFE
jgi:hypothetical protein